MDELFFPLSQIVKDLSATDNNSFTDENAGVHTYISEIQIETPVELDLIIDESGKIKIGSVPPLYYVDTTFKPSYHKIKFTVTENII